MKEDESVWSIAACRTGGSDSLWALRFISMTAGFPHDTLVTSCCPAVGDFRQASQPECPPLSAPWNIHHAHRNPVFDKQWEHR